MGAPHVLASPPKVALIGGGFIGPVHAEALRRIGVAGCRPARHLSRTGEAPGGAVGDRQGLRHARRAAGRFLDHRRAHRLAEQCPLRARQATLEAGKHVLCEKPLAISAKETAELVKIAAAHPKQAAGVNYNIRFYPLCQEMHADRRPGRARPDPLGLRILHPGLAAAGR